MRPVGLFSVYALSEITAIKANHSISVGTLIHVITHSVTIRLTDHRIIYRLCQGSVTRLYSPGVHNMQPTDRMRPAEAGMRPAASSQSVDFSLKVSADMFYEPKIRPKCVSGWGSAPDPTGGAHDFLPDPLVGWGGNTPPQTPHQSSPSAPRSALQFCSRLLSGPPLSISCAPLI